MIIVMTVANRVESGIISNPKIEGMGSVMVPPTSGMIVAIMRNFDWIFSFADALFE